MAVRQRGFARGAGNPAQGNGYQRRSIMNLGLLTGCALLGSLAAALWVRMVLF